MAKKAQSPQMSQEMRNQVQELELQITQLNENWRRALADYQNLLKRGENEKAELMKYVGRSLVSKLIPTLDILEMAAAHSQDQGVKMAVGQFQQVLKDEGLEAVVPQIGDPFDPAVHECIETLTGEPHETVAEVALKGYKIGDYVIRPAKVKVWQKS